MSQEEGRFKPGHEKLGGRQKGTKNKRTRLQEVFDNYDFDPVAILLKNLSSLNPRDAAKISLDLLSYIYPKQKTEEESPQCADEQFDFQMLKASNELYKIRLEERLYTIFETAKANGEIQESARRSLFDKCNEVIATLRLDGGSEEDSE